MDDKIVENALLLACMKLSQFTGSCPLDTFDYDMQCGEKCYSGIEHKCWQQ